MGDYNSYSVQHLSIQWVACDIEAEPDKCRSMQEIKEFMKRKFILTLENSSRFQLNEYNKSKIAKESKVTWHPMNSVMRQESIVEVEVGRI